MELSAGHFLQLATAMSAGVILFLMAYILPARVTISCLILAIPFQLIDSRFGSLNMVLTYVVSIAFFLRHNFHRLPLLFPILFICLAYLASLSQSPKGLYLIHGIYLVTIGSNILLFYLVYNFIWDSKDHSLILRLIVIINVLVLGHCLVTLLSGSANISLFGIKELAFHSKLERGRLVGPFHMVGATAEYMVLQTLILMYFLLYIQKNSFKLAVCALIAGNLAILIATANRGGVISLLFGICLFAFFFRKQIGAVKLITGGTFGIALLAAVSFFVIKHTGYNLMYQRLADTQIEGGIPTARLKPWSSAIENIQQKPLLGHGPKFRAVYEKTKSTLDYINFPHNLYLFLLSTIGITGFLAYVYFWGNLAWRMMNASLHQVNSSLTGALPKLGLIVLAVFFLDQTKVEFLRQNISDYQHYIFMLMATFLAFTDIQSEKSVSKTVI